MVLATAPDEAASQKVRALQRIHGIGGNFAAVLVREVLYRSFDSRKQLASYVGFCRATCDTNGPTSSAPSVPLVAPVRPWSCRRDQRHGVVTVLHIRHGARIQLVPNHPKGEI